MLTITEQILFTIKNSSKMLIDVIGRGPFLKLNLHQISDKMVYNMTIFQTNKKKKKSHYAYKIIERFLKFNMAAKRP